MKYLIYLLPLFLYNCSAKLEDTANEAAKETPTEVQDTKQKEEAPVANQAADKFVFPPAFDFLSHTPTDVQDGVRESDIPTYYIIGWSEDSKLAYAVFDETSIPILSVIVQDLRTDKSTWEGHYEDQESEEMSTSQSLWAGAQAEIEQNLKAAGIIPLKKPITLQAFPASLTLSDGSSATYTAELTRKMGPPTDQTAVEEVVHESVTVSKNGKAAKEIFAASEDLMFNESAALIGYLKSPFEDRMVVCKITKGYVFEGSGLNVKFIGCDLN